MPDECCVCWYPLPEPHDPSGCCCCSECLDRLSVRKTLGSAKELEEGDRIDLDGSVWRVSYLDGDGSIYLIDKFWYCWRLTPEELDERLSRYRKAVEAAAGPITVLRKAKDRP